MVIYFWFIVIFLIIKLLINNQIFFINDELIIIISLIFFFYLFFFTIRRIFLISLYTEVGMICFVHHFVFNIFLKLIYFLINMSELLFCKLNYQLDIDFMSTLLHIHYETYVFLNNRLFVMFKSWNQAFTNIARSLLRLVYSSKFSNYVRGVFNWVIKINGFVENIVNYNYICIIDSDYVS